MPTGPRPRPLEITPHERRFLSALSEGWSLVLASGQNRRAAARDPRKRAAIVLACDRGLSNSQVARLFKVTPGTVWKWRDRFRKGRLDGLRSPRPTGRPKKIRPPT